MNKVEDEKIKEKIDVQNIIVLLKMKKKNIKKKIILKDKMQIKK